MNPLSRLELNAVFLAVLARSEAVGTPMKTRASNSARVLFDVLETSEQARVMTVLERLEFHAEVGLGVRLTWEATSLQFERFLKDPTQTAHQILLGVHTL